jgi:hypothetical protein
MKRFLLASIISTTLFGVQLLASEGFMVDKKLFYEGAKLYNQKCASCHITKYYSLEKLGENYMNDNKTLKLKAPVLNQLTFRLKQQLGSKSDPEFQFYQISDFIKDYAINPERSKSLCMEMVLDIFGTMPSMKGKVTEDELEKIAHFMYWNDPKKNKK